MRTARSDGSYDTASLLIQIPFLVEGKPVEFLLKDMEKTGAGITDKSVKNNICRIRIC